jgi:anti-sigma B factor antagonist
MELQYRELTGNIRLLRLIGSLDINGVGQVETQFSGYGAGEKPRVIVDLSGVTFLSSIGIRLLTINAKSIASRGGRMVLLSPIPEVRSVLEVTGMSHVIAMYDSMESAEAVVTA